MCVGFTPGCYFSAPLDPAMHLAAPKWKTPRDYTPARCLALAGFSTGAYPVASPGGYQLLGRLAVNIYEPHPRNAAFPADGVLLRAGDRIRYRNVGALEYDRIWTEVEAGRYDYEVVEEEFDVTGYVREFGRRPPGPDAAAVEPARHAARSRVGAASPARRSGSGCQNGAAPAPVESGRHRVRAQPNAVGDAAAIDAEPRNQATTRRYGDLPHERETGRVRHPALELCHVAVVALAAAAQQRQELRMAASERPLCEPAWTGRAIGGVLRAQDEHMGRSIAQRRAIRDRLQQTPVHHRFAPVRAAPRRSAPGSSSSPERRPGRLPHSRSHQHPELGARRRHRDGVELRADRQPGLRERPAARDDLVEEEVEIEHGPAPQRARWIDEGAACGVRDAGRPERRLTRGGEAAGQRSRRAAVHTVYGGHETGSLEHEAHAGADRAPHPSAFHHERDDVRIRPPARTAVRGCARPQQLEQRVVPVAWPV